MKKTADAFEREYAARSGVTVQWLRDHGRIVAPCHCGESICEGWQSVNGDDYRDDQRRKDDVMGNAADTL